MRKQEAWKEERKRGTSRMKGLLKFIILAHPEGYDVMPEVEEVARKNCEKYGSKFHITGWKDYEVSSCVDPANYDEELGKQYALANIASRLWKNLGFVLQWADHGLKTK